LAHAHAGSITIHTEIPVTGDAENYVVNIEVAPQPESPPQTLDELYGALSDAPLPEITDDPLPEARDEV
jgi:hypothetical protein